MSNANTLELRALDDDDLMGIVGGCPPCSPPPCHQPPKCQQPCHEFKPCGGVDLVVVAVVCL